MPRPLDRLLKALRRNPAIFIGEPSVDRLYWFLHGAAATIESAAASDAFLADFRDFVARRYPEPAQRWSETIVNQAGSAPKGWELFWTLADEFQATRRNRPTNPPTRPTSPLATATDAALSACYPNGLAYAAALGDAMCRWWASKCRDLQRQGSAAVVEFLHDDRRVTFHQLSLELLHDWTPDPAQVMPTLAGFLASLPGPRAVVPYGDDGARLAVSFPNGSGVAVSWESFAEDEADPIGDDIPGIPAVLPENQPLETSGDVLTALVGFLATAYRGAVRGLTVDGVVDDAEATFRFAGDPVVLKVRPLATASRTEATP